MNDPISVAVKEALRDKDAQSILKIISINVWNRIEFARRRKGLKIFETTITQEILHFITIAAKQSHFKIKLFEAKSEKTNGNDIECFVETSEGFLLLPMQAKIIYQNSLYPTIDHKVGEKKIEQIELLIEYARKNNGYPLYLFYNYIKDKGILEHLGEGTEMDYKFYGISYLDAFHLKNNYFEKKKNQKGKMVWKIPSFKDLHPMFAKPFFKILDVDDLLDEELDFTKNNIDSKNINLRMYTEEEIVENENWVDLINISKIDILPTNKNKREFLSVDQTFEKKEFNPKFRIIFSSQV